MNRIFLKVQFLAVMLILASVSFAQTQEQIDKSLKLIEIGNPKQALVNLQTLSAANPKDADALAALSIALMANNKPLAEVQEKLEKAYDINRKSVLVRTARGILFGKQNKRDDASKEFAQAIKIDEKNVATYLYAARFYLSVDSTKAAEVTLYRAQGVNEKDVRPYIGLAELYEKQRAFDLAIGQYEEAKKLDANDVTVMAKLAGLYFRTRKWDNSINEWIKITKVDPSYSRAYYEIAKIFFRSQQFKNAAEYAEKYNALEPDDVDGIWLLAQSLSESNQYQKALPFLEKASQDDSLKNFTQLYLARSYFFSSEFPKANAIFSTGKDLGPYDYYYWGYSLISSGDTTGGIAKWHQSFVDDTIRTKEDQLKVHQQIISLLSVQKKYGEAAKEYLQLAQSENKPDNYVRAGQLFIVDSAFQEAKSAFDKASSLDAKNIPAQIGLADLEMKTGNDASAESRLEAAATTASTTEDKESVGQGYARLGIEYYTSKNYEKSSQSIEKSLKYLSPNSPYLINAYNVIGAAYLQQKKNDKAEEFYKKVLAINPNDVNAKKSMEFIKQSKGKK